MADRLALILHPKLRVLDDDGNALSGGRVYTYEAGSTAPIVTYSDPAQTVANANPVTLDSQGEAAIYVTGAWKMVIKDASGVLVRSHDGLVGITTDVVAFQSGVSGVEFVGADSDTAGVKGMVPAPAAGDQSKLLTGGGGWVDPVAYLELWGG